MKIAVDAMGGDHAPREIVRGVVDAHAAMPDVELTLFGDERAVEKELRLAEGSREGIRIVHCTQVIDMAELPVEALRQKRDSSIVRMAVACAHKEYNACISAGNTGAFAAAGQLKLGLLEGVSRSGIAVVIPAFHGPIVICDVGANIAAKPHHLQDYATMASVYAHEVVGIEQPRVGLLSIGEEDLKGTELVRDAWQRLKEDDRIRFVGNVEGQTIFRGECDVVVCDGFVGNIVLKLTEGLSEGLFETIARELTERDPEAAKRFDPIVKAVWAKHDYSEYGGAPLLGVDGVCIICHGRSDRRAIRNAVRVAREFVVREVNAKFTAALTSGK